jgi:hypothetical protein
VATNWIPGTQMTGQYTISYEIDVQSEEEAQQVCASLVDMGQGWREANQPMEMQQITLHEKMVEAFITIQRDMPNSLN